MYDLNDTIVAISSPTSEARVIVRITGPDTIRVCRQIFKSNGPIPEEKNVIITGHVVIDAELSADAQLYLFFAPHSYTADHVAEIHIHANSSVTGALMSNLLGRGLRVAGPGEFTARAYLNGKIDLAQAEAVNEIVVSCNTFQLAAAEKLLSGRLAEVTERVRSEMMDCLSLIEAGLDFSGEDIEFISRQEAIQRLAEIKGALEQLLCGSIRYESVIDLPAVGIAGAPNAGKSSLLNRLLGRDRSIVSAKRKTTRDVLTGLLTLAHCRCVLFDCAGLIRESGPVPRAPSDESILDELAHEAAIEALRNSSVVVFCIDISKADWSEDLDVRSQILDARRASSPPTGGLIPIATKSDLLFRHGRTAGGLANRLAELNELFGSEFLATSAKTGCGVGLLYETIDRRIVELALRSAAAGLGRQQNRGSGRAFGGGPFLETGQGAMALTVRHMQVVTEAIENISESINELKAGPPRRDEVAAMMLRAAYQIISSIESADRRIDEQILEKIFSRFCIGK